MLRAILLLCAIVILQAATPLVHSRSLSSFLQSGPCANGFDQDDKNRTVEHGRGVEYCFKRDLSCIDYKIEVKTKTSNDELAKLLVVVTERDKSEDHMVSESLDDYKEDSVCKSSPCEKKVDLNTRKTYAILVINNNYSGPEFNEASGLNVTYAIDISGCPTTSHILAVILIVFFVIFAILGCISCFMVRSRRQNKLAQLRQEAGYPPNGPVQFTQMTATTYPLSPMDSSQQTQSAVPWAIPVDSPSNTAPLPPRF